MPHIFFENSYPSPRPKNEEFDQIVFGLAVDDPKVRRLAEISAQDGLDWRGTGEYFLISKTLQGKYGLSLEKAEQAYDEALSAANRNADYE